MLLGAGAVLLFLPPIRLINRWLVRHVEPSAAHQLEVITDLLWPFLDQQADGPERVTGAIVILADCSQDPAPVYVNVIGTDEMLAGALLEQARHMVAKPRVH